MTCLGRLRIACRYLFNLWQLRQGVDSLAEWLERLIFIRADRVRIPWQARFFFFQLCFIPLLWLVFRKMGARPRLDYISPKMASRHHKWWLPWNGECNGLTLLLSMTCLGKVHIACAYIFNLWQLRQGVDSLAQWLECLIFIRADLVRIPRQAGFFFSHAPFLC